MSPETIEGLVREYGYGIILVGTYFDHYGIPLFLVFGGIAASHRILDPYLVFLCGFAGGWIADLFLYFLGYKTSLAYWMQFSFVRKLSRPITLTGRLFQTRPAVVVVFGRFLFAVSKIIPPFAGMIGYDVKRYVFYSLLGNALFSLAYTAISFTAGPFVITSLKEFTVSNIIATVLFIALLVWLTRRLVKLST